MTVYNDQVSAYITQAFVHQDEAQAFALEDSLKRGLPTINVKPEEGRFLQFLVRSCGAAKAVEIGTLGGYSGIWIARGLAPGGQLITLEKNPAHAEIARQHFALAGVSEAIQIRLGDAHQLLRDLTPEGPFDFVFIDAEKPGYMDYYEWTIENLRLGGVFAAHNAFRKGSVMGLAPDDEYTEMTRQFLKRVAAEKRLISTLYPAGDGTLVAVKTI